MIIVLLVSVYFVGLAWMSGVGNRRRRRRKPRSLSRVVSESMSLPCWFSIPTQEDFSILIFELPLPYPTWQKIVRKKLVDSALQLSPLVYPVYVVVQINWAHPEGA